MKVKLEVILEVEDEETLTFLLNKTKEPQIGGARWYYISVKVIDKETKPE